MTTCKGDVSVDDMSFGDLNSLHMSKWFNDAHTSAASLRFRVPYFRRRMSSGKRPMTISMSVQARYCPSEILCNLYQEMVQ